MTLSNRITFAGAIPVLVAFAIVALLAGVFLTPSRPASAAPNNGTCDLSPVLLDTLLARYELKARDCNELNFEGGTEAAFDDLDADADTWDFSDQELTEFAISDDDADILRDLGGTADGDGVITPGASIAEDFVRYIDLTGNPLTVEDVNFKHIPSNVAIILSAESNVAGFQQADYTVTEGAAGYVSIAFPDLFAADITDSTVTVDVSGDSTDPLNSALTGDTKISLISFGTGPAAVRTLDANSEADNVVFYWPITVAKDNENDEEWDITLAITEDAAGISDSVADFELVNDEADVTILDADAPALSVCDRSEDVEDSILALTDDPTPDTLFGGNTRCDDLTLRDLGAIEALTVDDADDDDREAIANLIAGDFEGLVGLDTLHIVGARGLPSGIFSGVGSKATAGTPAVDSTVEITFAQNDPDDDEADKVGNFKPSTIPAHVWEDQEARQVITLTDDTNAKDEGTTKGFDADLYAGTEGEHIFVLTNSATSAYVIGSKVDFGTLDGDTNNIQRPGIANRGALPGSEGAKVSRFAITIPEDDNKNDGNLWLFLFEYDQGSTDFDSDTDPTDPANVGQLKDVATVAVTDDD